VLLARNTEPAYVPRWFDEGVAMVLSKELRWESAIEVARLYVARRLSPYRDESDRFDNRYVSALDLTSVEVLEVFACRRQYLVPAAAKSVVTVRV